jgi:23S rRNA (cytidine1920-2'-O)/16S rRNA (cytidine1409-2'-O)-methyltransferase
LFCGVAGRLAYNMASMATRMRIDRLLVERGLTDSREKALRLILAGDVFVDGERVDKAGALVAGEAEVELVDRSRYVSRGGEKLAHALDYFNVPVSERICIDIGASTGGFTDCLLQRGATRVYAVDVGTGQLDPRLRKDARVVVMEKTNARALDPRIFPEQPSLAVIDVAFISLEKILPATFGVLQTRAEIVMLIKPQFEVGRDHVGKGGVVRDPALHRSVVARLARYCVLRGWHVLGVSASPLRGPKGNREFFLHTSSQGRTAANIETLINRTVEALA